MPLPVISPELNNLSYFGRNVMKFMMKCTLLCLTVFISYLHGETVFAGSNTFQFPVMTGVKTAPFSAKPATFTLQGLNRFSRSATFTWSFPSSRASEKQGNITVYTLLGKVVTRIPIYQHAGTTQWNYSKRLSNNGLYIARITYGATSKNLKMMMWN